MKAGGDTMVLNAQQELVVHELDRNLLLVASAGTGKTNTLAYRVAHILDTERARADQILCMTLPIRLVAR